MVGTGDSYAGASLNIFSWGSLSSLPCPRKFPPTFLFAFATSRRKISVQCSPRLLLIICNTGFFPMRLASWLMRLTALTHGARISFFSPSRVAILVCVRVYVLSAGPALVADLQIESKNEVPLASDLSPDIPWVLRAPMWDLRSSIWPTPRFALRGSAIATFTGLRAPISWVCLANTILMGPCIAECVGPPTPISFVTASPISWVHSSFYVLIKQVLPRAVSPSRTSRNFITDVLTRGRPVSITSSPPRSRFPG